MPQSTDPVRFDTNQAEFPIAEQGIADGGARFEPADMHSGSMKRPGEGPALTELVRWLTRSLAVLAVVSSFALMLVGATPLLTSLPAYVNRAAAHVWAVAQAVPLSALPLLLAGSSYLLLQVILRPRPMELVKRVMLGVAFLLWGVVQMMPAGNLATELGNVVIALYVVDLGMIIAGELRRNEPAGPAVSSS